MGLCAHFLSCKQFILVGLYHFVQFFKSVNFKNGLQYLANACAAPYHHMMCGSMRHDY